MAAMQGAGTLQGQPQPSPSQQGQFIFTPVPQMPPGQPQVTGPHQGQVTPAQFGQSPLVYLPQGTPNASVPTSASSSVSYMPGKWFPGTRHSFRLCLIFSCYSCCFQNSPFERTFALEKETSLPFLILNLVLPVFPGSCKSQM